MPRMPALSSSPWGQSYHRYLFIIVSLVQGIVVISLEGLIFAYIRNLTPIKEAATNKHLGENTTATSFFNYGQSMLIYLILFMFSQVFQVILSWESIYFQNTLQILGILLFNFMTFVYSIFQYNQLNRLFEVDRDIFLPIIAIVTRCIAVVAGFIGVSQLCLMYLGYKLYQEFGWSIYRIIGSDLQMRRMLLIYHSFLMVLKFDFFFFIGFISQFLFLVAKKDFEYDLTIISVPIILVILWLGVYGVKRENKYLLGLNLIGFFLGALYFCFKIYRLWVLEKYKEFRYFLTLFGIQFTWLLLTFSFPISSFPDI
ncbi:hypothetical protein DSO57_1008866 [Entomophthora muscae]|uniref:Uncharacterized protein n=1 Tax=Entomophthora muscae TaxID=34485 RepID=A0ACC2RY92_9FUNG|nr:hypothetical protein DSO57_1008866 [Entomophthora muscae]